MSSIESIFDDLTRDVEAHAIVISEMGDSSEAVVHFDSTKHLNNIGTSCNAVAHECSKLSIAFSKSPQFQITTSASDFEKLSGALREAVNVLCAWTKTFPRTEGAVLHKTLQDTVLSILNALLEFVKSLPVADPSASSSLVTTATVWSCCDSFAAMPRSNVAAVCSVLSSHGHMISDAMAELKEMGEDDEDQGEDDDADMLSPHEKSLLKPLVGLAMVCKSCLKKLLSTLSAVPASQLETAHLDSAAVSFQQLSSCLDDVVMEMYSPVSVEVLVSKTEDLDRLLAEVFTEVRSLFSEDESQISWLDFLEKAAAHNLEKLSTLCSVTSPET